MKKFVKITFGSLLLFVIAFYLCVVYLLPSIINSKTAINKIQSLIFNKTKIETKITGLNLKVSPKLIFKLNVDSIDAKYNNTSVLDIKNLSLNYKLLQNYLTLIKADNILIDGNYIKQFKKSPRKQNKVNFKIEKIPEIHISNLVYNSDEVNIRVQAADTINDIIQLKIAVNSPFLKETLKIGDSGSFKIEGNKLKADKFGITFGNSHLYLDGTLVDENMFPDFDIKGENLPISELMAAVLHFQKAQNPSRRFIENFKNFKGIVNVNLKLNKDGIWGTCIANNFGVEDVAFSIPTYFKETVFYFNGDYATSKSEGVLGNEKVTNTVDVTELKTLQPKVIGKLNTMLTQNFTSIPGFTVLNSVNVNVVYKIISKKPDVYVNVDIPAKSDLIYNSFYLGLRNYKRKMYANTFKDGNDLYLREYKYSYLNSDIENVIVSGDGFFVKINDVFTPQYITCHTNGYVPISVTGSFGEKVRGGEFKGDLKYDFKNNQVLGTFDIIKARHKAFFIEEAHVVSKNGMFNITSNGLFKGEKYLAELSAKNNIFGETLVYNMKLFLDKLVLETIETPSPNTHKENKEIDSKNFHKKFKDFALTINNWEIAINEIKRDKFILKNVKLIGSLKNDIFDFKMNDLNFADGIIKAAGIYDFAKDISKMTFEAKNINSNKVAEMTLNLQDQIEGIANAKVDISAKDMFKFLDAHCMFEVKEGFLPKLGDTEFMIENSKYKLADIVNVDFSQKDLMKDDIKGTFDVHNTELKNINITTWHELSAMFLEGSYEMEKQYADLQLFWHYSKDAPKGVRIFGIPLRMILKVVFRPEHSKELYESELQQIPKIKDDDKNSTYYRIRLKGDINNNKTDLTLKEIR